ncbi:chemotaxis protein [Escherichia coli]|nr:chemotaxis protein [Escherichia coli]
MRRDGARRAGTSLRSFRDQVEVVTNGAIVIHTQRLKSDPGGNLLS